MDAEQQQKWRDLRRRSLELVARRSYFVPKSAELQLSVDEFNQKFPVVEALDYLVIHTEDSSNQLFVFFLDGRGSKIDVNAVNSFIRKMKDEKVTNAFVVHEGKFSKRALQVINNANLNIEVYQPQRLMEAGEPNLSTQQRPSPAHHVIDMDDGRRLTVSAAMKEYGELDAKVQNCLPIKSHVGEFTAICKSVLRCINNSNYRDVVHLAVVRKAFCSLVAKIAYPDHTTAYIQLLIHLVSINSVASVELPNWVFSIKSYQGKILQELVAAGLISDVVCDDLLANELRVGDENAVESALSLVTFCLRVEDVPISGFPKVLKALSEVAKTKLLPSLCVHLVTSETWTAIGKMDSSDPYSFFKASYHLGKDVEKLNPSEIAIEDKMNILHRLVIVQQEKIMMAEKLRLAEKELASNKSQDAMKKQLRDDNDHLIGDIKDHGNRTESASSFLLSGGVIFTWGMLQWVESRPDFTCKDQVQQLICFLVIFAGICLILVWHNVMAISHLCKLFSEKGCLVDQVKKLPDDEKRSTWALRITRGMKISEFSMLFMRFGRDLLVMFMCIYLIVGGINSFERSYTCMCPESQTLRNMTCGHLQLNITGGKNPSV